jgi:hypothetical protein
VVAVFLNHSGIWERPLMRNRLRIAIDHQGASFFDNMCPYLEGVVAVALMAVMGIVSVFVTAGVTGDSTWACRWRLRPSF